MRRPLVFDFLFSFPLRFWPCVCWINTLQPTCKICFLYLLCGKKMEKLEKYFRHQRRKIIIIIIVFFLYILILFSQANKINYFVKFSTLCLSVSDKKVVFPSDRIKIERNFLSNLKFSLWCERYSFRVVNETYFKKTSGTGNNLSWFCSSFLNCDHVCFLFLVISSWIEKWRKKNNYKKKCFRADLGVNQFYQHSPERLGVVHDDVNIRTFFWKFCKSQYFKIFEP